VILEVDAERNLGPFRIAARFRAEGGVTALFGPSGSGKTALVHLLAGLLRPDRGRIAIDGEPLVDTERRIFVAPHRRRLGCVFQDARLLPHLTVRQNLLYGHWLAPARGRYAALDPVVELLGIAHLLGRRPGKLSGGERQRVAIGRAWLASPRLLLMDEPLASLDADRREEILPYLERLRDEVKLPMVYVSHALDEVVRLATRIVLLGEGSVQAVGTAAEVLGRLDLLPLTGRGDAGAILPASVQEHDPQYGLTLLRCAAGELRVPRLAAPPGTRVRVRIRARDVILALAPPREISALNALSCTVVEIGPAQGSSVAVRVACGEDTLLVYLTRLSLERLALGPGRSVYAIVKSVAIES
jgi:molybdate transport system ATP-binding protein